MIFGASTSHLRQFASHVNGGYSELPGFDPEEMKQLSSPLFKVFAGPDSHIAKVFAFVDKTWSKKTVSKTQKVPNVITATASYEHRGFKIELDCYEVGFTGKELRYAAYKARAATPEIGGLLLNLSSSDANLSSVFDVFSSKKVSAVPGWTDGLLPPGVRASMALNEGKLTPTIISCPQKLQSFKCNANNPWWAKKIVNDENIQDLCIALPKLSFLSLGSADSFRGQLDKQLLLHGDGPYEDLQHVENVARLLESIIDIVIAAKTDEN